MRPGEFYVEIFVRAGVYGAVYTACSMPRKSGGGRHAKRATIFSHTSSSKTGLSAAEVKSRLKKDGPNHLALHGARPWEIFFRQFKSAFVLLLCACVGVTAFLREWIDAGIIAGFVIINAVLGFAQEYHSERTAQLLQRLIVAKARVIRAGKPLLVPSADLVVGDVIVVKTGDVIPADMQFFAVDDLSIDESALTGESIAVFKSASTTVPASVAPGDAPCLGFSGTTVVGGVGTGVVFATGARTGVGRLATMTDQTTRVSGYEKNIQRFSTFTLRMTVVGIAIMLVANTVIWPHETAAWTDLVIFSIALAISVVPEGLPLVMTFSLSRGAMRLAKQKVLVKRLSAIEDLGSVEVLCTDKTGTLTENRMVLRDVTEDDNVLLFAALATDPAQRGSQSGSFDDALWAAADDAVRAEVLAAPRMKEIAFSPETRTNGAVVRMHDRVQCVVRGAPEAVLAMVVGLSEKERGEKLAWASRQGHRGRRVLAVAMGTDVSSPLHYVGMLAFEDPLKDTATAALRMAEHLGVRMVILTGDACEVAEAVARKFKLISPRHPVVSGVAFATMTVAERKNALQHSSVFARVTPEQKFMIIRMLQEHHVVGFLGEGINDAPALKAADVAIVVQEATDVARAAADAILLERSLFDIVNGIREGREVFSNTTKYLQATITSNFGNFYAVLYASLTVPFLPMTAIQILLVNLLSDFPMMTVATDKVDVRELAKPARYDLRTIIEVAVVLGVLSTVVDIVYFRIFVGGGASTLQTNWFIGSILTELLFLFSIRTSLPFYRAARPSMVLVGLSLLAALVTIVLPYSPWASAFGFVAPSRDALLLILAIAAGYFLLTEVAKVCYYHFRHPRHRTAISRSFAKAQ